MVIRCRKAGKAPTIVFIGLPGSGKSTTIKQIIGASGTAGADPLNLDSPGTPILSQAPELSIIMLGRMYRL